MKTGMHIFLFLILSGLITLYMTVLNAREDTWLLGYVDSVMFDLDVRRTIRELTTDDYLKRNIAYHPLYKLMLAPFGISLAHFFTPLTAVRILSGIAILVYAILTGFLVRQMSGSNKLFWYGAFATALTFTSMLLSNVPDASSFSGICTVVPYLWLFTRKGKPWTRNEALVWATIAVFGVSITITQSVHSLIAFGTRLLWIRGLQSLKFMKVAVFSAGVIICLIAVQAKAFPKTEPSFIASDFKVEQHFFYNPDKAAPLSVRALNVAAGVTLFPFVAPHPHLSSYLLRLVNLNNYMTSFQTHNPPDWKYFQKGILLLFVSLIIIPALWFTGRNWRVTTPLIISITAMWILHIFYGHETIMYSGNWVALLVVLFVLGVHDITLRIRSERLMALYLIAVGATALAASGNNWVMMEESYMMANRGIIKIDDTRPWNPYD